MSFRDHFIDAFRLTLLRAPRHLAPLSAAGFVALGALLGLTDLAGQWLAAGETPRFQMYGVNSIFAWIGLSFAIIALFARANAVLRRNLALAFAGLSLVAILYSVEAAHHGEAHKDLFMWLFILLFIWNIAASWRACKASDAKRPLLLGAGATLSLWLAMLLLPNWPVFPAENFSPATANIWEGVRSAARAQKQEQEAKSEEAERAEWRLREQRLAAIEAAQPERIETALAALAPRQRNKANVYVVGIAGWGKQDVFEHEIGQSMEILKARFGADGHMVTLVNSSSLDDTRPIASLQNLSAVLRGVAARMDHDKDALVLNMTSHGSVEGFALQNEQLVYRTLSPEALKVMLDGSGVKNRVLIVSACYSGVFAKAFDDANSVVITAAAADRTSFGCENGRQWTYFGEAFFEKGLKETGALVPAFAKAIEIIAARETDEKLKHSEPQMRIGAEFHRRFPAIVGATPAAAMDRREPEKPKGASPRIQKAEGRTRKAPAPL